MAIREVYVRLHVLTIVEHAAVWKVVASVTMAFMFLIMETSVKDVQRIVTPVKIIKPVHRASKDGLERHVPLLFVFEIAKHVPILKIVPRVLMDLREINVLHHVLLIVIHAILLNAFVVKMDFMVIIVSIERNDVTLYPSICSQP